MRSSMPQPAERALNALSVVGALWLEGKTLIAAVAVLCVGIWSTYNAVTSVAASYRPLDALLVALAIQAALTATQLLSGGGTVGYIAKISFLIDAYINVRFMPAPLQSFAQNIVGGVIQAALALLDSAAPTGGGAWLMPYAPVAGAWLIGMAIAYLPETLLLSAMRKRG